jgi:hypothetical protein
MHLVWFAHYQGNVPHEEPLKGSFWWKDVLKHVDNFRGVAAVVQGRGDTSLFWKYNWTINGSSRPMSSPDPRLFSFVLNDSLSVTQVYNFQDFAALFHRSLSNQAFQEFEDLSQVIHANTISEKNDVWRYCWGESYAASKFYKHIHAHIQVPKVVMWLQKSCCTMKSKVFLGYSF